MTGRQPAITPRLLSRSDAAAYCAITANTLDKWIEAGRVPAGQKIDGRKLWDRRQLDAALDDLFVATADQTPAAGEHRWRATAA